jgi:hypothetical protein
MTAFLVRRFVVSRLPEGDAMSDYMRERAKRDFEQGRPARNMSNATSQEREKYNAALEAARRAAANK